MKIAIAIILTLGVLCSAGYARGAKKVPILSCETYSLRDDFTSGKLDYLTAPKVIKDMGIPGICYNSIWMKSYDNAYLDTIKKACADAGVKITGFIIEGNIATLDDAARDKQIAEDIKELKAAAYLGAPVVRINLGGAGTEQQDDTIGAQRCIDAINKQILPVAKQLKVKITLENHGGITKKADTILKVIKGTDPKWVGSCLDFGNWPDDVRNTESAKLAPYAYHVHAKCHNFLPNGEAENMDYKYLLGLLKQNHYTGAVSIEFEGGGDQAEGVKKTVALIEKYWPELGAK
jgi:sugar phosphate isomerase/epimerase